MTQTEELFAGVERMIAANQRALLASVQQMIAEAVKEIPSGPPGRAGAPGERGEKGADGVAGRDGRDAPPLPGPQGEKGFDGRDGKDGRDSDVTRAELDAAIAKALHEHMGILLKSIRREGRTWKIGEHIIGNDAALEYRGVWTDADAYEPGDAVTYGGSLWICTLPARGASEKPELSKSWRLAAKRGRDGREPARVEGRAR